MNFVARRAMLLLQIISLALPAASQFARRVDPFLGADAGGNVFPGPVLPFGMIKPGPDMVHGENDPNAGWAASGDIRGFSQTHVSGTGGGAKYGNILVMPTVGDVSPPDSQSPGLSPLPRARPWTLRPPRPSRGSRPRAQ